MSLDLCTYTQGLKKYFEMFGVSSTTTNNITSTINNNNLTNTHKFRLIAFAASILKEGQHWLM
jgi:hypothetical protein